MYNFLADHPILTRSSLNTITIFIHYKSRIAFAILDS